MGKGRPNPPVAPKNNQPNSINKQLAQVSQSYSGPIPPPQILEEFERIIPGAAERILHMAEENGKHQREMERSALNMVADTTRRGQRYGLLIGLTAFITCIIALWLGSEETAMTIGGVTIIGLVTVFVTSRSSNNNQ